MLWYTLFRFAGLVRWMPLHLAYFLGNVVATVGWWLWPGPRRHATDNLTHVLGDRKAARCAARYSFLNFARYNVDFLRALKIKPDDLRLKIEFDQWDAVDAAFAGGKGVIFAALHMGNWDMGGAVLTAHGYPLNVVADTYINDRTNALVVQTRRTRGMKVIPSERAAAGITRAMRRNEALALLMDTPVSDGGVEVTFFGERTTLPAGPAWIALRTGARVIPIVLVRPKATSDRLICLADFDVRPARTGDDVRDVQALTQRIVAAHERFIRAYPDQWFIFRPMWPAGSAARPAVEPALARKR